jgi:hypothetical protein
LGDTPTPPPDPETYQTKSGGGACWRHELVSASYQLGKTGA